MNNNVHVQIFSISSQRFPSNDLQVRITNRIRFQRRTNKAQSDRISCGLIYYLQHGTRPGEDEDGAVRVRDLDGDGTRDRP